MKKVESIDNNLSISAIKSKNYFVRLKKNELKEANNQIELK